MRSNTSTQVTHQRKIKNGRVLVIFPTFTLPLSLERPRIRPNSLMAIARRMDDISRRPTNPIPVVTDPRHIWEDQKTYQIPAAPKSDATLSLPIIRKRSPFGCVTMMLREILYLLIASQVGVLAWDYLEPWPVYRVVALVTLVILWANFASSPMRAKSQVIWHPSNQGRKKKKPNVLTEDTATYLQSLRGS